MRVQPIRKQVRCAYTVFQVNGQLHQRATAQSGLLSQGRVGVTGDAQQKMIRAQQLLRQSLSMLKDKELKRDAWRALAELAEQRQDMAAAAQAYKEAAKA